MARGLVTWQQDHLDYLFKLYMQKRLGAGQCTKELNGKFKSDYSRRQVYRACEMRGWTKKRQELETRIHDPATLPANQLGRLASTANQNHKAVMERFTSQAERGADKASRFIDEAGSAKELASAVTAHKAAVSTYRICAGLDGAKASSGPTFQFNFASFNPEAPRPVQVVDGDNDSDNAAEAVEG